MGVEGVRGHEVEGYRDKSLYLLSRLSRYPIFIAHPITPYTPTTPLSPTTPFFMACGKDPDGLQDLVCHVYCRRAILTRYHRPHACAGCVNKRFKLKLERLFVSTLKLLNLDCRPLTGLRHASGNRLTDSSLVGRGAGGASY